MRVKVIANGVSYRLTRVTNAETGEEIEGFGRIEFVQDASTGENRLTLQLVDYDLEIESEATVYVEADEARLRSRKG